MDAAPNEPNMRRHPDMLVTDVIGYTNEQGRISELEIRGEHAGYEEAPTWLLAFVAEDATFRIHQGAYDDNTECELTGLEVYAPESLLASGLEGLTSLTLAKGTYADMATIRGTRRAIRDALLNGWVEEGDNETLAQYMADVTEVQA